MEQQGDTAADADSGKEDEKPVPQPYQNAGNILHSAEYAIYNQTEAENDDTYRCSFGISLALQGDQHENQQLQHQEENNSQSDASDKIREASSSSTSESNDDGDLLADVDA